MCKKFRVLFTVTKTFRNRWDRDGKDFFFFFSNFKGIFLFKISKGKHQSFVKEFLSTEVNTTV